MQHAMKRSVVLASLLSAFITWAQSAVEAHANEPEKESRANSMVIQLSEAVPVMGVLGTPTSVGVALEHRFGSFGLSLGATGAAGINPGGSGLTFALEPAGRYYLRQGKGLWFGSGILVGYSSFSGNGFDGLTLSAGVTPTVGFTHNFDSGLVVQVYAGPQLQVAWTRSNQPVGLGGIGIQVGSSTLASGWLRTGVGIGWAF